MADGKIVIETDLDASGIEGGLKKLGSITTKGLKIATTAITGTATALGGISTAAVKIGSDFEAQMSRVKAISGATGEEFEKLKKQAIQLGADTAFSASEAAQGMENLAAAGFTTSEIMEAMPGMLNLAAASGEDLASSADIAASTLRGFGLEASDAAHVADVLAENANRTNSSVSETGEAMKYVAPLARAAGISLEETAAAIGIMANAGIQGSQAGTTLRGAISRLSKPTDAMTAAMEELGISFYDSKGKMKSLSDQVGIMRKAMSGMTDEQKNNYLVTLYGQEALSGMLALINEGEDELSSLTEAYKACDGSAEAAAETMQDNLQGAIEQLGGSAESLGIIFYEDVSDSLKDTVKVVNKSVDNITDAFENGGLDKAIEAAGDEFADLATAAAEHAPDMVDTAVDFIESFTGGVMKNKSRIVNAAGDMAETLAGGLADLLPREVQKPVEQAIEAISDSFKGGGLEEAGETVVDTFDNLIDVIGDLAEVALPPLTGALDLAGDNLDLIAGSAAAAFTAFKGYKVITETTSVLSQGVKVWKTASAAVDAYNVIQMACTAQGVVSNATLTAGQAAVGLLTGRVSLATAAQTAWNAVLSANPIGLVVTAVGALAAGLAVYSFAQKDATDTSYELSEAQKESIKASKDAIESIEQEAEARQKNIDASTLEIDTTQSLWNELSRIVDENGKVKAGYEARAQYIVGELSQALGIEIDLIDGEIQNYGDLEASIYDVIAAKKAEAVLSAMKNDYGNAMQEQAEKAEALALEYEKLKSIRSEQADVEEALAVEESKAIERYSETGQVVKEYSGKYYELKERLAEVSGELETQQAKFDEANTAMADNQKVISDYQMLTEATMSGSTDAINNALAQIQSGLDTTLAAGSDAAIKQATSTAGTLVNIFQGESDGLYSLQQQTKDSLAETMGVALNQVGTDADDMKVILEEAGKEGSAAIVRAMAQAKISGTLSTEAEAGMESFIAGFSGLDQKTQDVWAQAWFGALEGLEGFEKLKDPAVEGSEAFLKSLSDTLMVQSPSKAVREIFSYVWPGAVEGLSEGEESLNEKGSNVITSFLTTIREGGLLEGAKQIGSNIINFFTGGMISQKENVDGTSRNIADSSNTQLGAVDTQSTGARKTSEYNTGIGSNKGNIDTTSKEIANSSNTILGSEDTQGTGSRKTNEYNLGVGSNKGKIDTTSQDIANSSNTILGSKDTQGTGSRKTSEYNTGLGSNKGNIDTTSKDIANSSDNLLGSVDTGGTGRRKGSEYNSGLGSNSRAINSTSRGLSDTANSGMGTADTEGTGRRKSNEYNSGLESANTYNTGRRKAQEGNNGLGSVDASGTGNNFIQGFINGFGWADVWSAAWNIGKRALSALSSAIKEGSPSRLTKLSGKYFGQGFSIGIDKEGKNVEKSADNLAQIALDSMDLSSVVPRMRETMAFNTGRIAKTFSTEANLYNQQEINKTMHLSEEDIILLAKIFGAAAGDKFADNMGDMKIEVGKREFGRMVREVSK